MPAKCIGFRRGCCNRRRRGAPQAVAKSARAIPMYAFGFRQDLPPIMTRHAASETTAPSHQSGIAWTSEISQSSCLDFGGLKRTINVRQRRVSNSVKIASSQGFELTCETPLVSNPNDTPTKVSHVTVHDIGPG